MARDFTIRFRKRRWQIPEREAAGIAPGDEIVVERRLAHVPRSQVVQAYQRSDLLERRPEVLQAWCDYITRR